MSELKRSAEMKIYLTYSQTPELMALESPAERDAVHAESWQQLRTQHPRFWAKSFVLIVILATIGAIVGHLVGTLFDALTPTQWIIVFGGLGGGIGALLHTHLIATQLRPLYEQEIASRRPNTAEQGNGGKGK